MMIYIWKEGVEQMWIDKRKGESGSDSLDPEILALLKADVDTASADAGNWEKISELAYDEPDSIKRSTLPFIFPAVCALLLAVGLGVLQLFSEVTLESDHQPACRAETDVNKTEEAEEAVLDTADGYRTEVRSSYEESWIEDIQYIGGGKYNLYCEAQFQQSDEISGSGVLYAYVMYKNTAVSIYTYETAMLDNEDTLRQTLEMDVEDIYIDDPTFTLVLFYKPYDFSGALYNVVHAENFTVTKFSMSEPDTNTAVSYIDKQSEDILDYSIETTNWSFESSISFEQDSNMIFFNSGTDICPEGYTLYVLDDDANYTAFDINVPDSHDTDMGYFTVSVYLEDIFEDYNDGCITLAVIPKTDNEQGIITSGLYDIP